MEIVLSKGTAKNKKFKVLIKTNEKKKTINFGDERYEDYTQHGDENRKELYKKRHKNDNL